MKCFCFALIALSCNISACDIHVATFARHDPKKNFEFLRFQKRNLLIRHWIGALAGINK